MDSRETNKRAGIGHWFLKNKFWFAGSVIFFLAVSFFYLQSVTPKYNVSCKVTAKSALALDNLQSGKLLQKTVESLPYQVSYYKKENGILRYLRNDSLPVELIVSDNAKLNTATMLDLQVISNQQFQITQEDTITSFRFNEVVDQPFGKFTVVKGPRFSINSDPVTLKFNDESALLQAYKANYTAKRDEDGTIVLNVLVNYQQEGIDFLNKLLTIYNFSHPATVETRMVAAPAPAPQPVTHTMAPANTVSNEELTKAQDEITALKNKADKLSQQIADIKAQNKLLSNTSNIKPVVNSKPKPEPEPDFTSAEQESRLLATIEAYVKNPVNKFVQIPHADKIQDRDLKNLVDKFNNLQTDYKQLFKDSGVNNATFKSTDRQLTLLKGNILDNVILIQDGEGEEEKTFHEDLTPEPVTGSATKSKGNKSIGNGGSNKKPVSYAEYADELADVNRQLHQKIEAYRLLTKQAETPQPVAETKQQPVVAASTPVIVTTDNGVKIIEKPGQTITPVYPDAILFYLLAVLAGFAAAVLLIYLKNLALSIKWANPVDLKKINEKLSGLINIKQID